MFGDDSCPDVDVKRHLLAFLYSINWKGGSLFPSRDEIDNPPVDGVYKTSIEEEELVSYLKFLFKEVLKREDKLTLHSGGKTGHLWARLRGASVEESVLAADHAAFQTAKKCMKDADALASVI